MMTPYQKLLLQAGMLTPKQPQTPKQSRVISGPVLPPVEVQDEDFDSFEPMQTIKLQRNTTYRRPVEYRSASWASDAGAVADDHLTDGDRDYCPRCGRHIQAGLPACLRHLTDVLLKVMESGVR